MLRPVCRMSSVVEQVQLRTRAEHAPPLLISLSLLINKF